MDTQTVKQTHAPANPAAALAPMPAPIPESAPVVSKKAPRLRVGSMALAEYKRALHWVEPEPNVTVEDMLEPSYWADVSAKLHPLDRIETVAADGSWFAELIVLNAGRLWAKVEVLRKVDLMANAETTGEDPEYDIVWRNPHHKYGVIRRKDKSLLKEDFQTKEEAARFLQEHLRTLAR